MRDVSSMFDMPHVLDDICNERIEYSEINLESGHLVC